MKRKFGVRNSLKRAVSIGVVVTAAIALTPGLNDFFFVGLILGAFTAVFLATRREVLDTKDSAQLGFAGPALERSDSLIIDFHGLNLRQVAREY